MRFMPSAASSQRLLNSATTEPSVSFTLSFQALSLSPFYSLWCWCHYAQVCAGLCRTIHLALTPLSGFRHPLRNPRRHNPETSACRRTVPCPLSTWLFSPMDILVRVHNHAITIAFFWPFAENSNLRRHCSLDHLIEISRFISLNIRQLRCSFLVDRCQNPTRDCHSLTYRPSMKPYVLCHMCTSLDGKIIGHRWGKLSGYKHESTLFETTAASIGIGAHGSWAPPRWMNSTAPNSSSRARRKISNAATTSPTKTPKPSASARTPKACSAFGTTKSAATTSSWSSPSASAMITSRTSNPPAFRIYSAARKKSI